MFLQALLFSLLFLLNEEIPAIRLPVQPPVPIPAPNVSDPAILTKDQLYVFDSDVPVLVFAFPEGIVKFTKEDGPVKIKGLFFDGNGKVQTKTFKGKFVYTLDVGEATGTVTLVVIPVGAKSEDEALRRIIQINGPRPPPPAPVDPVVPTDPLMPTLQAAFKEDGAVKSEAIALAAVYKNSGSTVDNPAYTTLSQLLKVMHDAGQTVIPDPKLSKVRRVIADELNLKLGRDPSAPIDRTTTKAQFVRMAALLEVLK